MDKVSVVIPTYNREATILRSIQSVLRQTYSELELIIVDDGSTDRTRDIIKGIDDSRIRYIPLENNGGVANARNVGAGLADGEWIAFQDSDDVWHIDKLEKQMAYSYRNPQYSMIYCSYVAHSQNEENILMPMKPYLRKMEGKIMNTLLLGNTIGAPTICVKRSCFLESGGFSTAYKSLEDWEYVIRFAKTYEIGFVEEPLLDAYLLPGGVSSHLGEHFASWCKMAGQFQQELRDTGLYEQVIYDILQRAEAIGIGASVQRMLELYLQTGTDSVKE